MANISSRSPTVPRTNPGRNKKVPHATRHATKRRNSWNKLAPERRTEFVMAQENLFQDGAFWKLSRALRNPEFATRARSSIFTEWSRSEYMVNYRKSYSFPVRRTTIGSNAKQALVVQFPTCQPG